MPKPTDRSSAFKHGYHAAARDAAEVCEAVASESHTSSGEALRIAKNRIKKLRPARQPHPGAPAPKESTRE
jgi:hypothetical protein